MKHRVNGLWNIVGGGCVWVGGFFGFFGALGCVVGVGGSWYNFVVVCWVVDFELKIKRFR